MTSLEKSDMTRTGAIISVAVGVLLIAVQKAVWFRIVGAIFLIDAVALGYMSYTYNKEATRNQ